MRKLLGYVVAAGVLGLAWDAHAAQIAYDPFAYPAGSGALANQNGGGGWSSDWGTGTNNVVSPGLTFAKNGAALTVSGNSSETVGNNVGNFRQLPSLLSTGTAYVSFLAKLDGGTAGNQYAGVSLYNGGSERVFMGQPSGGTDWGLDQVTQPQSTHVPVDATTHLFVAQIDFGAGTGGNDRVRFYVDPTPGLAAPDITPVIDVSTTGSAAFNQIRIQSGAIQVAFDELRVTTDYASAVPVPEPATLSVTGLAGLGLLARRRRRA